MNNTRLRLGWVFALPLMALSSPDAWAAESFCDRSAGFVKAVELLIKMPGRCAEITDEKLQDFVYLYLDTPALGSMDIDRLVPEDFRGFDNVTWVSIANTDLPTLPPRLFRMLPKLKRVSIRSNELLTSLPDELFWGVRYIEISVEGNKRLLEVGGRLLAGAVHTPDPKYYGFRIQENIRLARLPTELLREAEGLTSAIVSLPPGSESVLRGLHRLEQLMLTLREASSATPDLLKDLGGLTKLWFAASFPGRLNPEVLRPLKKGLTFLSFSQSMSAHWPPGFLEDFTRLEDLAIKLPATELEPEEFSSLKRLRSLYLWSKLPVDSQQKLRSHLVGMNVDPAKILFLQL